MRDIKKAAKAFAEANQALVEQNFENFINAMQRFLTEFPDIPPNIKQLPILSAFKALGQDGVNQFLTAIGQISNNFVAVIRVNQLSALTEFKALGNESVTKFFAALWEFLNEFERVTDIRNLAELSAFSAIGSNSVEKFLAAVHALTKNFKDVVNADMLNSLSAFQDLDTKDKFLSALQEFADEFKATLDLQRELQSLEHSPHKIKDHDFLSAITEVADNLTGIERIKVAVEESSKLIENFLLWSQEFSAAHYSQDKRHLTDSYLDKLIIAGSAINLFLLRNYLKTGFALSAELCQEVDNIKNFSELSRIINIFESEKLRNLDKEDTDFFRLQIAKSDHITLMMSSCLRFNRFVSMRQLDKIQFSVKQLYQCNSANEFYAEIEKIKTDLNSICEKIFEKDKDNKVLDELANLYHYKTLMELGRAIRDQNLTVAATWFELAFINAVNEQEKIAALKELKIIYKQMNGSEENSMDKRKSVREELRHMSEDFSNLLSGERKSLRLEELPDALTNELSVAILAKQIKNIAESGSKDWHFRVGELLLNRFVYLVVGADEFAGPKDSEEVVAYKCLGDELYSAYLVKREVQNALPGKQRDLESTQVGQIYESFLRAFNCSDENFKETATTTLDAICNFRHFQQSGSIAAKGYFAQDKELCEFIERFNEERAKQNTVTYARPHSGHILKQPWMKVYAGDGRQRSGMILQNSLTEKERRASSADIEGKTETPKVIWRVASATNLSRNSEQKQEKETQQEGTDESWIRAQPRK